MHYVPLADCPRDFFGCSMCDHVALLNAGCWGNVLLVKTCRSELRVALVLIALFLTPGGCYFKYWMRATTSAP
jgi:hypothetical protein